MDVQWVKIESWHIIKETWFSRAGYQLVRTVCGLERMWDGTSIDRLPGGSEKSCENCLRINARGNDTPEEDAPEEQVKPKRSRKKTQ